MPVIGGHSGVTTLPLLVKQVPGVSFTEQEVADLTKRIQNAGTEVVEAKAGGGSATLVYGPGSCTFFCLWFAHCRANKALSNVPTLKATVSTLVSSLQPLLLGKNGVEEA